MTKGKVERFNGYLQGSSLAPGVPERLIVGMERESVAGSTRATLW